MVELELDVGCHVGHAAELVRLGISGGFVLLVLHIGKYSKIREDINDAFSVGMYSMSSEVYGELLTTRWKELTNE